ncbi:hypothetical protein AS005_00065 [Thermotoga sp. KOL6]|nr:hypothetical protein AS005_00065 [Thermotoga sp. KOL6]
MVGIALTAFVIFYIIFLSSQEKKKEFTPESVVQKVKRYYERKGYQVSHQMVNDCVLLLVKKGARKILLVVGTVNFEVVKEVLYTAYMNRIRDVRVIHTFITKEAQEAFDKMQRRYKVHRTKVKKDEISHFESVAF